MHFDAHADADAGAPVSSGSPSLGYIVENPNLQGALSQRLLALADTVRIVASSRVVAAVAGTDVADAALANWASVEIETVGGERSTLRARLLVRHDIIA